MDGTWGHDLKEKKDRFRKANITWYNLYVKSLKDDLIQRKNIVFVKYLYDWVLGISEDTKF